MISILTYAATAAELLTTWKSLPDTKDFEWLVGTPEQRVPAGLLADERVRVLSNEVPQPNLVLRALLGQAQAEAVLPSHGGCRLVPRGITGFRDLNPRGGCIALGWVPMKDSMRADESHTEEAGWRWTTTTTENRRVRYLEPFGNPSAFADPRFASPFHLIDREYATLAGYSDTTDARNFDNRTLNFDLALRSIQAGAEMRYTAFMTIGECLPLTRAQLAVMDVLGQRAVSPDRNDSLLANWCENNHTRDIRRLYVTAFQTEHPCMETLCGLPVDLAAVETDSVGELLVENYLPFLSGHQAVPFFEECYRVLCHGGWLRLRTPSTQGNHAWANPLYRSWWNATTFLTCTNRQFAEAAGRKTYRFYNHRIWNGAVKDQVIAAADLVAIKRAHGHHGVMEI